MDRWTDVRTENLPILQDRPYRGRCPKKKDLACLTDEQLSNFCGFLLRKMDGGRDGSTDGQKDVRTDRWTVQRTDRLTDRQTECWTDGQADMYVFITPTVLEGPTTLICYRRISVIAIVENEETLFKGLEKRLCYWRISITGMSVLAAFHCILKYGLLVPCQEEAATLLLNPAGNSPEVVLRVLCPRRLTFPV